MSYGVKSSKKSRFRRSFTRICQKSLLSHSHILSCEECRPYFQLNTSQLKFEFKKKQDSCFIDWRWFQQKCLQAAQIPFTVKSSSTFFSFFLALLLLWKPSPIFLCLSISPFAPLETCCAVLIYCWPRWTPSFDAMGFDEE